MGQTAMWKLRRLGPRAATVAERYADHTAVAVRAATLLPTLGAFARAYDEVRRSDIPWTRDPKSGREASHHLVVVARMWLPLIVRDVAGVDRSNYLDSVISDDLIDDVDQLITVLRDGSGADGQYLPYRDDAIRRIGSALRAAQTKWSEAEATDLTYAELMLDLRTKAMNFRSELEWFSQSVAFALNHTDPDYLRLLPSRAWRPDDADDRLSPKPEIVEPATQVTGLLKMPES